MTAYDDNNTGVLFVNDRKTSDKAPDFTGSMTVAGRKMQLAAWKRESKQGKKFLSIKVSEFRAKEDDRTKPSGVDAPFNDREPPPPRDEDIF